MFISIFLFGSDFVMGLAVIDYVVVAVYLLSIVIVGVWVQKKSGSGIDSYFLGERGIPWWALAASGIASNIDVSGTSSEDKLECISDIFQSIRQ